MFNKPDTPQDPPSTAGPSTADPSSKPASPRKKRIKRFLLFSVAALVLIAGAYGIGWMQGNAEIDTLRTTYTDQANALQTRLSAAESALDQTRARNRLFQTRGWLYMALIDLEKRNFGTANEHIQKALSTAKSVEAAIAQVDEEMFSALRDRLDQTELEVARDLASQRSELESIIAQFDHMLPPQ